jgi:hypothetical protein
MLFNYIKRNIFPALILTSAFMGTNVNAQERDTLEHDLSLSFQFRPKLEFRDGNFRPLVKGEKPAALISDRIRLKFDYSYKNVLAIRVTPQAVNVWGQANMVQGAENSGNKLGLFETWAKIRISPSWYTQVGRQVISLDDERLFGELDWAQGGRAHDAVSIHFSKNKYELKGFFAYNQNYKTLYGNNLSNPSGNLYATNDAFPHKWMQTVWASFPLSEASKITAVVANLGFQNTTAANQNAPDYFMQTYGANYFLKTKKVDAQVAAYFQGGRNAGGKITEAYMGALNVAYNINNQWNIGIGSDIVSGNNVGSAQKRNTAFNPIFHTGHKFYGHMDYYYAGNGHSNAGLSDSYLKVGFKTEKGFGLNLIVHQFFTVNKVESLTQNYDANLGQEIDLLFNYKINKFVSILGGYSFYITTPTINYLKNVVNGKSYQQWAWFALNVNPTLLKIRK